MVALCALDATFPEILEGTTTPVIISKRDRVGSEITSALSIDCVGPRATPQRSSAASHAGKDCLTYNCLEWNAVGWLDTRIIVVRGNFVASDGRTGYFVVRAEAWSSVVAPIVRNIVDLLTTPTKIILVWSIDAVAIKCNVRCSKHSNVFVALQSSPCMSADKSANMRYA